MDKGRRNIEFLTAKIQGREKSYGTYLYVGLSKAVEERMGWRRDDLVQLILDEERDLIILRRIFRVDEARYPSPSVIK